jgi:hypothetical protein
LLAVVAPALIVAELALLPVAAAGGWLAPKLAATCDTVLALPRLLRERRHIQAQREASVAELTRWLTPELDSVYLGRPAALAPLRWALRAYWALARGVLRAWGPG